MKATILSIVVFLLFLGSTLVFAQEEISQSGTGEWGSSFSITMKKQQSITEGQTYEMHFQFILDILGSGIEYLDYLNISIDIKDSSDHILNSLRFSDELIELYADGDYRKWSIDYKMPLVISGNSVYYYLSVSFDENIDLLDFQRNQINFGLMYETPINRIINTIPPNDGKGPQIPSIPTSTSLKGGYSWGIYLPLFVCSNCVLISLSKQKIRS